MATSDRHRNLVDHAVSRAKLERDLNGWKINKVDYRRKGWVMIRSDLDELFIEVAFFTLIPMGSTQIPAVFPTIRLDYDNYDLLPPSMSFIDFFTGQPVAVPANQAWVSQADGKNRNVLIENANGKQFLCFPGIREYHEHPDHDGDSWLLYRREKYGSVSVICERVWSTMTNSIAGVHCQVSLLTPSFGIPLEQARDLNRQIRAAYDAHVAAYAAKIADRE